MYSYTSCYVGKLDGTVRSIERVAVCLFVEREEDVSELKLPVGVKRLTTSR